MSVEESLVQIRDYRRLLSYPADPASQYAVPFDKPPDFEFRHVYYTYPNTQREVLKDINLSLRSGERIAIVRENGSEKTTFINLLTGLLLPTRGIILVNGEPLENVRAKLRASIAIVLQDFYRYDLSIRNNILLGRNIDSKRWNEILEMLELDEWINTLPDKEDTLLDVVQEQGREISDGQWQRIALARACVTDTACLFVMDEPTASLDPKLEAQLYE